MLAIDQKPVLITLNKVDLCSLDESVRLDLFGQVIPVVGAHVALAFKSILMKPLFGHIGSDFFQVTGMDGDHVFLLQYYPGKTMRQTRQEFRFFGYVTLDAWNYLPVK